MNKNDFLKSYDTVSSVSQNNNLRISSSMSYPVLSCHYGS